MMSRFSKTTPGVLALTWVHSDTGLKLPVRQIADALVPINAVRPLAARALLCVDGAHGLGVEDATVADLGCDFLVAGTHKWLFGPRGTGLVWDCTCCDQSACSFKRASSSRSMSGRSRSGMLSESNSFWGPAIPAGGTRCR